MTRLLFATLLLLVGVSGCGGGDAGTADTGGRRDSGDTLDAHELAFPDATTATIDAASADAASTEDARTDASATSTDDASTASADASAVDAALSTSTACGGRLGRVCPRGSFCNYPVSAACGVADAPGTCMTIPRGCLDEDAPVCGCDGMTYPNACTAASGSMSVASVGACPVHCDPDNVTCLTRPPRCLEGMVAAVDGNCWRGDCVPATSCTCTTFDDCPELRGYSEVCTRRGFCGPLL